MMDYNTFPYREVSSREEDRMIRSLRASARAGLAEVLGWSFRPAAGSFRLAACPCCLGSLAGGRCDQCNKVWSR